MSLVWEEDSFGLQDSEASQHHEVGPFLSSEVLEEAFSLSFPCFCLQEGTFSLLRGGQLAFIFAEFLSSVSDVSKKGGALLRYDI